jgi:hypothetical protein
MNGRLVDDRSPRRFEGLLPTKGMNGAVEVPALDLGGKRPPSFLGEDQNSALFYLQAEE